MLDKIQNEANQLMEKAVEAVKRDFSHLRTGRAHTGLVEHVMVEVYGVQQQLKAAANLSTPDASTIMVTPFDRSQLGAIEKGIQAANLGLNPSNDGTNIRLTIPALTQERRQEIVKEAHKLAEVGRVSIRNARHHANDTIKKKEKAKDLSEDESKRGQKKIQEITDAHTKMIDEALAKKEAEIMHV